VVDVNSSSDTGSRYNERMIRSIILPRVAGRTLDELQPALELFRALGFAPGSECHEESCHGIQLLAPSGGVELVASHAQDEVGVDFVAEVSDADLAYKIVEKLSPTPCATAADEDGISATEPRSGTKVRHEIADTSDGGRYFEVAIAGLSIGVVSRAKEPANGRGIEGRLDGSGKRFAIVVSRFNSFITERLLDGALQALRQCGTSGEDITVVHVPGAFEIPSAARQLAGTGQYNGVVCLGCLIRGGTLHYEVIANEVTRGVGQSAQETGVPHAFGVLTCDTLEQAIDRAGLKAGNKGFEAALAAVEMASLRDKVATVAQSEGR
jgi:6,7-dimethyl-8-ribityllumazine synthase